MIPFLNKILNNPLSQRLSVVALLAYGLLLAWLSLLPTVNVPEVLWDKALHAAAYLVFVALGAPVCREGRQVMVLGLIVLVYGGLLELAQNFVPGRYMSLGDLVANAVGVLLGMLLLTGLRRRLHLAPQLR